METNVQTSVSTKPSTAPAAPAGQLIRQIGGLMATAIVIGTVIGSGVFRKPSSVADNVPSFAFVAFVWIMGGVLALLGALALAEVAVLFPRSGGNFVFLREGYGRMCGFIWGWVEFCIIRCASIAALATFFTESLHAVIRDSYGYGDQRFFSVWGERGVTIAVIAVLTAVNIRGVKWGGVLQVLVTAVKVGTLLAIFILPFVFWARAENGVTSNPANLPAFSLGGLGTAMLGVQWAYHGWMNIGLVAGEVRQPQRNLPLAVIGGVGIIILLYLGANVAYHLVISQEEMRLLKDTPVVSEFGKRLLGTAGLTLASAAMMFSAFGALNGNLLAGPRLLYAMGHDNMVPKSLGAVHPYFKTPALAIAIVGIWSSLLVVGVGILAGFKLPKLELPLDIIIDFNLPAGKAGFDVLTDFAMFGAVIFETLALSTIFVFRKRMPNAERPYRCVGYPLVPIVYIIVLSAVAINTLVNQRTEAATALILIALGALVYVVFVPKTAPNLQ
jgi:APA family basic amino acid/polyamine antiporter